MKQPILYQRVEATVVFIATIFFYIHLHFNVLLLILLILSVDVFALGYTTKNNRIGAHIYNIGHSFIIPPVLLVLGTLLHNNIFIGGGLIWIAHITMDRMLGYGLKYETDFKDTHLGQIGKTDTNEKK
ncbi:MAG TPA: DUF4260 domain-containing protein [Candidatus Saccharimonadales bacterium]|nr:DUF4260 domain-containing protein [Candidatus Saccharimonadales bacterium]